MISTTSLEANVFVSKARDYLNLNEIDENGYGYIAVPASDNIRAAIDANYLTIFAVSAEDSHSGRDTAFIVSKDFKGDEIFVDKRHMGMAIGKKGGNIAKLVKNLDHRLTFVATVEKDHGKSLRCEIQRVARKR